MNRAFSSGLSWLETCVRARARLHALPVCSRPPVAPLLGLEFHIIVEGLKVLSRLSSILGSVL